MAAGSGNRRIRVWVLFGGRSGEHEVSLMSAASILGAIDREKYDVVPIGITKEGRWIAVGDPLKALTGGLASADATPVALLPDPSRQALVRLEDAGPGAPTEGGPGGYPLARADEDPGPIDVVFPVLHGPYGEDGTVQGLLELAGIPYVGGGVLASAAGMDKAVMKALFEHRGLPVAPYRVVLRKRWRADPGGVRAEIEAALGYPCFVKPANLGSSVGISKVHGPEELAPAMDEAAEYDRKLVLEAAVPDAREIEVSVLGNDEPVASVPGEIIPSREFYDYRAKYLDGASELIIPADLPREVAERVRGLAVEAFRAIDCAGLARVDFLVRRPDLEVFVNEINTIPGFTTISMYPKLWEASGLPYAELVDRLIQLALERHAEKQENRTSYRPVEG